ncbi:MAG: uroporphyrinogen decarboxylase family protein [Bacteroidota bacterium]
MNKKQQFDKLLSGELHSSVLFKPILMHFAARFNKTTYGKFASDYKVLVESNIRCMEYFDLDTVSLISDPYRETSAFGARIEFIPEGVPKCLNKVIQNEYDARNLAIPDIYQCERTRDRISGAAYYQKLLKGTVPVGGWIEGPLAEACDLAGLSEMLMNLMCDPDYSNIIMDKCMIVAREFAKAQIIEGCDYIGIGDAICSQIDAATYDLYVKERHKELVDHIHSLGAKAKLHICGNINHLLPSISCLNLDIIDFDWQVDLKEARKILGDNVVIKGNINPVLIQEADSQHLEILANELVQQMQGQKFILSGGCEIGVNTPIANLMKLAEISTKTKTN